MKRALCEAKGDHGPKIRDQKSCEDEGTVAAHCQRAVYTEVQGRLWAMPRAGPIPYPYCIPFPLDWGGRGLPRWCDKQRFPRLID